MKEKNSDFFIDYRLPFPVSQWYINSIIDRRKAGDFCTSLLFVVRDKLQGGMLVYPNIPEEINLFKYIWQIPMYGLDYAIKLGITFEVDKESINDLSGFVTFGDASEKKGEEPKFSEKEIIIFQNEVLKVIEEALELIEKEEEWFHFVYYVEVPVMFPIDNHLELPDLGIVIYPTVMMKKDNRRVSAVIISISEKTLLKAKEKAIKKVSEICMSLTLMFDQYCQIINLEWSENQKPIEYFKSIEKPPKLNQIYPRGKWKSNIGQTLPDFEVSIRKIFAMYNSLNRDDKYLFEKAITSHYFGIDLFDKRPTLAIVSFIAALNSFTKAIECEKKLSCTKCDRKNIPHYLKSEQSALLELISESFELRNGDNKLKKLKKLMKKLYGDHRSAYVHDAVTKFRKSMNGIPEVMPTMNTPYSKTHIHSIDLKKLRRLTRQVIIIQLSKHSNISINRKMFDCERLVLDKVYDIVHAVYVPSNTQVIPFSYKIQPDL